MNAWIVKMQGQNRYVLYCIRLALVISFDSMEEGSPLAGADSQGALRLRTLIKIDIELTKSWCWINYDSLIGIENEMLRAWKKSS